MDYYKRKLMSKNGEVTMYLAREFIIHDIGDRIKTVEEYADNFGTGRGTIQSAIKFLRDERAIDLESRGHLGTFMLSMDYKKLWDISGFETIMGVMPLPYSKRYEDLATGLYKAFEMANIPFSLAFMRGAGKRIETLGFGKYDFAITSKLAVDPKHSNFSSIEIISELGQESYVGKHVIIFADKKQNKILPNMRVGIDPDSIDQLILTKYECQGLKVDFVEISYAQIFHNLKNNLIDAAIWNGDELNEQLLDYGIVPLSNGNSNNEKEDTIAVIVANKDNKILKDILTKRIKIEEISKVQEKVINGTMIPSY